MVRLYTHRNTYINTYVYHSHTHLPWYADDAMFSVLNFLSICIYVYVYTDFM
jgi:hypothetical protein